MGLERSDVRMDSFVTMAPTLFCTQTQKFTTEINGLTRSNHPELHSIIEKVFSRFIPSFEVLLGKSLRDKTKYKQLAVIIKIQEWHVNACCSHKGSWHSEGASTDDIA